MLRSRPLSALLAGAALFGATPTFVARDAGADSVRRIHGVGFKIESQLDDSFCLDASLDKGQEGREVYIYKCHGRENQRWALTDNADGHAAVIGHEGLCLDVRGRRAGDGTPIQIWRCHFGANQQFTFTANGQIRDVNSGKCLTIAGIGDRKAVYIDDCDEKRLHQRWTLAL